MNVHRIAAFGSIVAVVAAIAAGLWLSGTPLEQRLLRFDQQRVADLTRLARSVDVRWMGRQQLPGTLADLVDGRTLSRVPLDPASDAPYEYRVTGPTGYELCAVFDRPSPAEFDGNFWLHEAGRHCFSFDVVQRQDR